jgi:predicted DNA-binding protein (UPF0251 family)
MDNANGNTQTPAAPPAPLAGPTVEELQAKAVELEKSREGLLRDLQEERRRRQELESRATPPAPSAAKEDVSQDELGKVLEPYIKPLKNQVDVAHKELESLRVEKAQNFLSGKTGKKWADIEADKGFQEKMFQVVNKYGVSGNVYDKTVRAFELMELEDLRTKDAERSRQAEAARAGSLPSGSPAAPVTNGKEYSADEFDRMDTSEFDALSSKGNFRKVDGKFVYTPR